MWAVAAEQQNCYKIRAETPVLAEGTGAGVVRMSVRIMIEEMRLSTIHTQITT